MSRRFSILCQLLLAGSLSIHYAPMESGFTAERGFDDRGNCLPNPVELNLNMRIRK